MVESYLQRHGPKRPPASARLGILLGLALVAFIVLGLILRALGAGAVLLGLVLFALGLALGWNARGQRQPAQKVAVLPVRPPTLEPAVEEVSPARAYALQVLELDTPASTQERLATEVVESPAEPLARAPEPMKPPTEATLEPILTLQAASEVVEPRAETTERKKWSPRAKAQTPSSTPETPVDSTVALAALETTPLETESPVVLEPANLKLATPERKKWTPKSPKNKILDTLSSSESTTLEPETESEPLSHRPALLEASAYPERELPDVKLPDANVLQSGVPARKKWTPKVKQESAAQRPAVVLEVAETPTALEPVHVPTPLEPTASIPALEPISSAKLDSRQILENMGIHLPTQTSNSSALSTLVDSSTPDSSEPQEVQASSGRRKWVPRRKA